MPAARQTMYMFCIRIRHICHMGVLKIKAIYLGQE